MKSSLGLVACGLLAVCELDQLLWGLDIFVE